MTNEYLAYIQSEEWRLRREQRLAIANHQCAVCGKRSKPMHVHHLTYARLFNEEMADLLPLCEAHHESAEELKRNGKLPRSGNSLFLATETVRLILGSQPKRVPSRKAAKKVTDYRAFLNSHAEFPSALKVQGKDAFQRRMKEMFKRYPNRRKICAEALKIWQEQGMKKPKIQPINTRAGYAFVVTEELMLRVKNEFGGFTKKNLAFLGVSWPPKHGWKKRLIGSVIAPETWRQIQAGT